MWVGCGCWLQKVGIRRALASRCQNPYLKQAVVVTGRVDWGHWHPSAMTLVIASCCGCWKRAVELQFNKISTCIFHCINRTRFTLIELLLKQCLQTDHSSMIFVTRNQGFIRYIFTV